MTNHIVSIKTGWKSLNLSAVTYGSLQFHGGDHALDRGCNMSRCDVGIRKVYQRSKRSSFTHRTRFYDSHGCRLLDHDVEFGQRHVASPMDVVNAEDELELIINRSLSEDDQQV